MVQKCGREARAKGHEPPTNLGFYLDEFFDFYGNQLNYASAGERERGVNPDGALGCQASHGVLFLYEIYT